MENNHDKIYALLIDISSKIGGMDSTIKMVREELGTHNEKHQLIAKRIEKIESENIKFTTKIGTVAGVLGVVGGFFSKMILSWFSSHNS